MRRFGKVLLIVYLVAIHTLVGYLLYDKFRGEKSSLPERAVNPVESVPDTKPELANYERPKIETSPTGTVANENSNIISNDNSNVAFVPVNKLMIPVLGIKRDDLRDTFTDSRSAGRTHNSIDIMAAQGTPVVAAADGEIARFFDSEAGGITIYQYSKDKRLIYYYAHLQKRAENLQEKQYVTQGTIIGYVGDTGNAGAGNFHLHFSVWVITDPKRYWDGENLNPYPLLKNGLEAK